MSKNEDDTDIMEKPGAKGHWIGHHWVVRKTGYCKSCDGKCENVQKRISNIQVGKGVLIITEDLEND